MIASYGQNTVKLSQALGTPLCLDFWKLKLLRDVKNSQGKFSFSNDKTK